jgi:hypothetical protein
MDCKIPERHPRKGIDNQAAKGQRTFAGNWDPEETDDTETMRSRHGYLIYYAGCPILWKSQLQNECALSITESEYTGLPYALRDTIPIMNLLTEMIGMGLPITTSKAEVHCRVFENNSGAVEMTKRAKYRQRTKHLNNRLHHFRSYVDSGQISIHKIDILRQPADLLSKPLNQEAVMKFRQWAGHKQVLMHIERGKCTDN